MKDKIKNGYFFMYDGYIWLKVGSRTYRVYKDTKCILFKNIDESKIKAVYKANGERVE